MSPADAIAMLDSQIALHGQDVSLRRVVANAPALQKDARAFVRGYRAGELVGGIIQGDTLVTFSPTTMPAEFISPLLKKGEGVWIDSLLRTVQVVEPVRIQGTLVRLNVTVRGGN